MSQNETETQEDQEQQRANAIRAWFQHIQQVLKEQFGEFEIEGQVGNNPIHGPLFAFTLKQDDKSYSCGFLLSELMHNFQNNPNAVLWLSSFFVDLIRSPESKPLPKAPTSEDEAKAILDKEVVPYCAKTVRGEFPEEQIYVDLELHPEQGPVLEVGIVRIKEGNNVCAMPLHYLLTLYLLNRDPAEPLVQGLYRLFEEQEKKEQGGE